MKMPTAVVRQRALWKAGEPVTFPLGEGSLGSEERLPLVASAPSNGHAREGAGVGAGAVVTSASPGGGERTKRFPILGPTRQETELYFRHRRTARHKVRTQSRPLVTRSADRVVPADCGAINLTYTSVDVTPTPVTSVVISNGNGNNNNNNNNSSSNSHHQHQHHRGFRRVESDPYVGRASVEACRSGPSPQGGTGTGAGPEGRRVGSGGTVLPAFERAHSSQAAVSLPLFHHRADGSPTAMVRTAQHHHHTAASASLDRAKTFAVGDNGVASDPVAKNGVEGGHACGGGGGNNSAAAHPPPGGSSNKRAEIPIKFLSESGQVRASELTHKVHRVPAYVTRDRDPHPHHPQQHKTIQPSKHGFHRRSKSPTFKRLVAVTEKLQHIVANCSGDCYPGDRCYACATGKNSPAAFRLPVLCGGGAAEGDLAGAAYYHHNGGGGGGGGGEREGGGVGMVVVRGWEDHHRTGGLGGGGDSDEEGGIQLQSLESLTSLPPTARRYPIYPGGVSSARHYPTSSSHNPRPVGRPARKGSLLQQRNANSPENLHHHHHHDSGGFYPSGGDPDVINGWGGAWEVDELSLDSGVDAGGRLTLALDPADPPTELHLFLPRLADTASEDSGSVTAPKPSPDRQPRGGGPTRGMASATTQTTSSGHGNNPHNPVSPQLHRANPRHGSGGGGGGGGGNAAGIVGANSRSTAVPSVVVHPHTSHRPPHHPTHPSSSNSHPHPHPHPHPSSGERNGRAQVRRFSSPVRVGKRDRTPKRRTDVYETYEPYEPFIKGEHLKEKLEDFPTLISLDND